MGNTSSEPFPQIDTSREDERRRLEIEAFEEQQRSHRAEMEEIRRENRAQEEEMERVQAEKEQALLEELRLERDAAFKRQEKLRNKHDAKERRTELDARSMLEKLKNENQSELEKSETFHRTFIEKQESKIKETQARDWEKVQKLNDERKETSDKIHQDSNNHYNRRNQAIRQNNVDIDNQIERNHKIQAEIDKSTNEHNERMLAYSRNFAFGKSNALAAGKADTLEAHFIDSVNNTRSNGYDAIGAVDYLEGIGSGARKGKVLPRETLDTLNVIIDKMVMMKLQTLRDNANSILNQQENTNKDATECQKIAREILEIVSALTTTVAGFKASLNDVPISDSPKFLEKIHQEKRELSKQLNTLPIVKKSNHEVRAILDSMQKIVGSSRVQSLEQSGSNGFRLKNK